MTSETLILIGQILWSALVFAVLLYFEYGG